MCQDCTIKRESVIWKMEREKLKKGKRDKIRNDKKFLLYSNGPRNVPHCGEQETTRQPKIRIVFHSFYSFLPTEILQNQKVLSLLFYQTPRYNPSDCGRCIINKSFSLDIYTRLHYLVAVYWLESSLDLICWNASHTRKVVAYTTAERIRDWKGLWKTWISSTWFHAIF